MKHVKDYFREVFPTRIATDPDSVSRIGGVIQFVITGEQAGTWVLDFKNQAGGVRTGPSADADLTLTLADTDFLSMMEKSIDPMELYRQEKIQIDGSLLFFKILSRVM